MFKFVQHKTPKHYIMTTFNQLIENAKLQGRRFDCYTTIAHYSMRCNDPKTAKTIQDIYGFGKYYEKLATYVTIQMTDNTFATWEFLGAKLGFGSFSIYNQCNGNTMRSVKQEMKALKKLGL